MKRLTKSRDRKIFGVCGGIAAYMDLDVTLVRAAFAVLVVLGLGFPVIIYLVLALVMSHDEPYA